MHLGDEYITFFRTKLRKVNSHRGGVRACCPYHEERTPSMFIYFDERYKNLWWFKCHGCGETGSINKLLKRLGGYHLVMPESKFFIPTKQVQLPTYRVDITRGFVQNYTYFLERGVSSAVCKRFKFCLDPSIPGAIMPVYCDGVYNGFVRRNFDTSMPRYYISKGMDIGRVVWGFDELDESSTIYVTEGIIDAACLWSAGYQAVALISKESYKSKVQRLTQFSQVVLVPDNDKEGLQTAVKIAKEIGAGIEFIPREYKDVSDWCVSKKKGV